jgi:hypothetical protein
VSKLELPGEVAAQPGPRRGDRAGCARRSAVSCSCTEVQGPLAVLPSEPYDPGQVYLLCLFSYLH